MSSNLEGQLDEQISPGETLSAIKSEGSCQQALASLTGGGCGNTDMTDLQPEGLIRVEDQTLRCVVCNTMCDSAADLEVHQTSHWESSVFTCVKCRTSFSDEDSLRRHVEVKHKRGRGRPRKAEQCSTAERKAEQCSTAERKAEPHSTAETTRKASGRRKQHKCDICDASFTSSISLKHHLRQHSKKKGFVCSICNKGFGSSRQLHKHETSKHADAKQSEGGEQERHVENPFKCTICKAAFACEETYQTHVMTHTAEKTLKIKNDRLYMCSLCGLRFGALPQLQIHERKIHENQFKCDLCTMSFSKEVKLKGHMMKHTGETQFKCEVCNAAFAHNYSLVQHMRVHTGERPFECHICDARFAGRSNLRAHIRVHTGEKRAACSECGKEFARKSHLKKHMRIHSGEKPFKCTLCEASFTQKYGLTRHLRVHEALPDVH